MFISEEQAQARLTSDRNIVRNVSDEVICAKHGLKTIPRGTITHRLSEETKVLIGATSQIDGCTETAKTFGISIDHASKLGLGKRGNDGVVDEELKEKVNKAVDKELAPVRAKAISLLTEALDNIVPEKLELLSAVKLVAVAKGLSGIIKDTNKNGEDISKYSFNIFNVPKIREIDRYDVVKTIDATSSGEVVA